MAIGEVALKRLWGRAGGRCAKCRRELTRSDDGHDSILGEAAHIRSPKPSGPRHDLAYPPSDLDDYVNLVLLCRLDHKLADDRPDIFTVAELLTIKRDHEIWVDLMLRPAEGFTWLEEPELTTLRSGTEMARVLSRADVYGFGYDHPESNEAAEAIKYFIGSARDWADISGDIGPEGHVDIAVDMHEQMKHLSGLGYEVLAGIGRYQLRQDWTVKGINIYLAATGRTP